MKLLGLKSAMEKKEFEKPLAELFCAVRCWGYQGCFLKQSCGDDHVHQDRGMQIQSSPSNLHPPGF